MDTALLADSIDLLLYGMGVVFSFLILLVLATTVMSRLVNRLFPDSEPVSGEKSALAALAADVDPLTVRIIQATLDQHRRRSK